MEPGDEQMLTHLRRGTVEYCVLALLRRQELYALDLVRALSTDGVLVTSEGTIYPLLSRLRRDGMVETVWQESPSGPPRRYYRLTTAGTHSLERFEREWARFRNAVDLVMKEN
jgi:PadR family transcriptional regulator PadR